MRGPIQWVAGANCTRFTKTWSPISSVFSIELEGISKACRTNVMMNSPVTRTAASEVRNSTVVSRGFSSCLSSFLANRSFLANGSFAFNSYVQLWRLFDHPKSAVPARHLEQMSGRISEMIKFITRCGRNRHVRVGVSHRPIDQQWASDDILLRHEPPVAAIQAFVPVIAQHEVIPLRNNEFAVLDQFFHFQPPASFQAGNGKVQTRELVAKDVVRARTVADIGFLQRNAVNVHLAVDQADAIAGNSHHTLHKMLGGVYGIAEDDDVSALHSLVGHEQIPEAASAIAEFVDQQVVAN